ncbi:unnamed protein product, partial [Vitis vinifera]
MKFHEKLILVNINNLYILSQNLRSPKPFSEVALQTRESPKRPYFPLPVSILQAEHGCLTRGRLDFIEEKRAELLLKYFCK